MASLRGATLLWGSDIDADADGVTVSAGASSAIAYPGNDPYVAVYIKNDGGVNATFDIEVGATVEVQAGLNAVSNTEDWYPYSGAQGITVNAGANLCFDLSPFGPEFIRLKRTDGGSDTTIYAFVTNNGAN